MTNLHLNNEKTPFIELSFSQEDFGGNKYRTLFLGTDINVFITDEQAEAMFDMLDKRLHKKTYSDLEDENLNYEIDLNNANELIEEYGDEIQERRAM